jgi:hypothetical protein
VNTKYALHLIVAHTLAMSVHFSRMGYSLQTCAARVSQAVRGLAPVFRLSSPPSKCSLLHLALYDCTQSAVLHLMGWAIYRYMEHWVSSKYKEALSAVQSTGTLLLLQAQASHSDKQVQQEESLQPSACPPTLATTQPEPKRTPAASLNLGHQRTLDDGSGSPTSSSLLTGVAGGDQSWSSGLQPP